MVFAQESIKTFFEHHGEATLAEGAEKKGTLIFTGDRLRIAFDTTTFADYVSTSRYFGCTSLQC